MQPPSRKVESKRIQQRFNRQIKSEAKQRGVPVNLLRYQVVFESFLYRLFLDGNKQWFLKGGASLLMRNGSGRLLAILICLIKRIG